MYEPLQIPKRRKCGRVIPQPKESVSTLRIEDKADTIAHAKKDQVTIEDLSPERWDSLFYRNCIDLAWIPLNRLFES